MKRLVLILLLTFGVAHVHGQSFATTSAKSLAEISVEKGPAVGHACPIRTVVPEGKNLPATPLWLIETSTGAKPIPVQVSHDGKELCWILTGADSTNRTFNLVSMEMKSPAGIQLTDDQTSLIISTPTGKVLNYYYGILEPPAGKSDRYRRSGFIHPLWSPKGEVLTQIHASDHTHHMGLWHPWTNTTFHGEHVDFWNIGQGTGTVRFKSFVNKTEGPVLGGFESKQEAVAWPGKPNETVVLDETFTLSIWNLTGSDDGYLIDYTIAQRCATDDPLHLEQYRYGGLCFRGTKEWMGENRYYLTSEGNNIENTNDSRARWCMVGGKFETGSEAGVLIMSHPGNHNFPEPLRTWDKDFTPPSVFVNVSPIKISPWELEPGKTYVRNYRIYVFNGTLSAEKADRLWHDFAEPPGVTLNWKS